MATHFANGINLLFPEGERFFIRSVRHYLPQLADDPVLLEQVRGFFAQEGRHALEHERLFEVLEEQGYDVASFLRLYERIAFRWIEPRTSPELRLAITAAVEHYTAIMAEGVFLQDSLATAHPEMRKLLTWHAAEELDHKAVAFDVLQKVNPAYTLRLAGLFAATVILGGFWSSAFWMLAKQDGFTKLGLLREFRRMRREGPAVGGVFARGIREYAKRGFHPAAHDNYHLAFDYFAKMGPGEA